MKTQRTAEKLGEMEKSIRIAYFLLSVLLTLQIERVAPLDSPPLNANQVLFDVYAYAYVVVHVLCS